MIAAVFAATEEMARGYAEVLAAEGCEGQFFAAVYTGTYDVRLEHRVDKGFLVYPPDPSLRIREGMRQCMLANLLLLNDTAGFEMVTATAGPHLPS